MAPIIPNRQRQFLALVLVAFMAMGQPARAVGTQLSDPSLICDQVATIAAARSGVPISVLKAIMLTETGRKRGGVFRPWPWTVNMEGKGLWFDSQAEALAYVKKEFARGARSFDVACFQINYKWHHQHFASLEAMFDPMTNALYAARHLRDLFAEKGDWTKAAGAYHSRTPKHATRYSAVFAHHRARLTYQDDLPLQIAGVAPGTPVPQAGPNRPGVTPARVAPPRVNTFPLLQVGLGGARMGSLVPLNTPSAARGLLHTGQDDG